MEILIRNQYSPAQIKRAEARSVEFRPSRYTSGCANLDNMVALNKAVVLCETHARKFSPKAAKYLPHPDKKMRRVRGNCDVCGRFELSTLYLNEHDALEERKKMERYHRAAEYAHILT